ncbi:MAG TPA: glycosyltransferase family 39 protein [Candidatus Bathyarchaeia archaeon]|nr:glycosyltransferase family 39 protein [Candidatus Bathyarchaeia archaeon]
MTKNWAILLIIILASFLRIYQIGLVPHGFNADEAAIGYNDYSLITTGRDEHGNFWPLHFRSFNDYKPGGYFYLALPFVKLLGLSEPAVRLPSVIFGVWSVYLIFLLARQLIPVPGNLISRIQFSYPEIAALMLAISPWHIQFSRGAWETNVATAFLILGTWLFVKGVSRNRFSDYVCSLVAFVVSAYVYHSSRILAPLLLLLLIWLNRKIFFLQKSKLAIWLVIGFLLSFPLLLSFLKGGALARFSGVGITGDIGPFWNTNRLRGEHGPDMDAFWVKILHNRPLSYLIKILANWSSHFGGDFLFISGDPIVRSNCPGIGQFYYLDLLFFVLGAFFILRERKTSFGFLTAWLMIAPLPASLTLQSPHALRSHSMVVPFLLIVAYGIYRFLLSLKSSIPDRICNPGPGAAKGKILILLLVVISVYFWQLGYFLKSYLADYPINSPQVWEYGMKELVSYLEPIHNQYRKILVTDKYDQPYILFLFYLKYPPAVFQKEAVLTPRDKFGFSTVRDFDNFHFEEIDWEKLKDQENVLIVGTDEEIPDSANIVKRIYFRNNRPAFEIAEL